ncbi:MULTISPECIES: hypothetical protein [Leptospira]|uniref:Uncharacterized protein n=3 Tax=Leptospira santarosai TaxID=28183 RepID=A0AB73MG90_9LEPT|nr:hypothetical protein [Leptospira santarosai]EKO78976.1 hypothetical protein LEP1GSC068_2818 [Leptospira sp. Fiocruz LV3954]EMI68237.1 hypothetical protein LEP1GSC076_1291 [Leptospira sp. Fiocruz LV4135]EMN20063.1 hypothetical protein LEP1GSC063_1991 [Leptospira santarosai serovar Arenal str. MAVJ 401]OLY59098.1 hypothetical protein BV917_18080 [Leptospira santarosai serovar Guaricura]OLY62735.1 hypothetical protein BWD11_18620 [Leptospira santarosai serovar Grippotyphosa]ONF79680.1 hypothe
MQAFPQNTDRKDREFLGHAVNILRTFLIKSKDRNLKTKFPHKSPFCGGSSNENSFYRDSFII